jgi:hypothetical protein
LETLCGLFSSTSAQCYSAIRPSPPQSWLTPASLPVVAHQSETASLHGPTRRGCLPPNSLPYRALIGIATVIPVIKLGSRPHPHVTVVPTCAPTSMSRRVAAPRRCRLCLAALPLRHRCVAAMPRPSHSVPKEAQRASLSPGAMARQAII